MENNTKKLKVGKWYKNTKVEGTLINCQFFGILDKYGYGIHLETWSDKWGLLNFEDYDEAKSSEIQKALIDEAKRRGYTNENTISLPGTTGQTLSKEKINDDFDTFYFSLTGNKLFSQPAGYGGKILFEKGKWAEKIELK